MTYTLKMHQNLDGDDSHIIEEPKISNHLEQPKNVLQSEHHENSSNSLQKDRSEGLEPELTKKIKKENAVSNNQNLANNDNQLINEVLRSRKIHKQLQNKKSRWKPSELELAVLKKSFESNQYPDKQDKEKVVKLLEEKFHSKIELNQLSRWFQHQRERCVRTGDSQAKKSTYKKFDKEELKYLQDCFDNNTYPKIEEMANIAKRLKSSLSKIENWYKHNRRSLAKKGLFELKNKKYFKKDELEHLLRCFSLFPRPTKQKYTEMAKTLDCDESHIKNWYSNKRKKQKLLAKKSNNLLQNLDKANEIAMQGGRFSLSSKQINGMSSNSAFLNATVNQGSQNSPKIPSYLANELRGVVMPGANAPISTNGGIIFSNRTIPITTNGVLPTATQGTIPIISNGALPIATNGSFPLATNGALPIISSGPIPISSNAPNYIIPTMNQGVYQLAPNGALTLVNDNRSFNPDQGQIYRLNAGQSDRPTAIVSQLNGSQLATSQPFGYAQPQLLNGQLPYPQMATIIVPSNGVLPQTGQIIQDPRNSAIYVNTSTPINNENKSSVQSIPIRPLGTEQAQQSDFTPRTQLVHTGASNQSSSNNRSSSEESMQNGSIFTQERYDTFLNKPTSLVQQTQGSTTDATDSNNNASSVSSTHSNNGHQQWHNANQQTNGITNRWVYPVNGGTQGGAMYIPVSQIPTSTHVNGQSQVSCYVSVLYPWQTVPNSSYGSTYQNSAYGPTYQNSAYGPTYQNNSYIYNNSTTFSNYNNGFTAQPNVGFNSNILIADFPVNSVNKGPQIQVSFENGSMQKAISPNLNPSNHQ